jgi:DNA-binding transcriptional LysR family regulator
MIYDLIILENPLSRRSFPYDTAAAQTLLVCIFAAFVYDARTDFTAFARLHPDIEMEILSSGELANLTNREADVAIRVVYDRKTLPLNLHGLKGPELFGGVYMSRDRLAAWRAGSPDPIRWIVISIHGIPDWAREGEVRTTGVPFRTTDAEAQIAAARHGLGMTTLPCFVGDADPLLVRVPGTDLHMYGTL